MKLYKIEDAVSYFNVATSDNIRVISVCSNDGVIIVAAERGFEFDGTHWLGYPIKIIYIDDISDGMSNNNTNNNTIDNTNTIEIIPVSQVSDDVIIAELIG